ncbi:hypothetical protein ACWF82_10005 [Nocardia sp. NPDC055053]
MLDALENIDRGQLSDVGAAGLLAGRLDVDRAAVAGHSLGGAAALLAAAAEPSYRLTVPGAAHLGFTDAPLYLPPIPALLGTLKREESLRIPAEASRAYLDAELRGQGNGLTNTLAELGTLDQPS